MDQTAAQRHCVSKCFLVLQNFSLYLNSWSPLVGSRPTTTSHMTAPRFTVPLRYVRYVLITPVVIVHQTTYIYL